MTKTKAQALGEAVHAAINIKAQVLREEVTSVGRIVETRREIEYSVFVHDVDLHVEGEPRQMLASGVSEHGASLYINGLLTGLDLASKSRSSGTLDT